MHLMKTKIISASPFLLFINGMVVTMDSGLQMVMSGRIHFAMDTEYVLVTLSWPKNVLV